MSTAIAEIACEHEKPLVRRILGFLKDRSFEAGERLPAERALAARFGVGRNALREAIATLISLRVVEARPNSGIYLRHIASESSFDTLVMLSEMGQPPSPQEILETMEARVPLEREVCRLACKRRTTEDISTLRRILDESDGVVAAKGNLADLDQAFHLALVESTHNSVLVRLLHSFYMLNLQRRRAYFAVLERGRESAETHREIVDAVVAMDVERADRLMRAHLGNARIYWGEILGSRLDPTEGITSPT